MAPSFEIFGFVVYAYPLFMGMAWGIAVKTAKALNRKSVRSFRFLNLYLLGLFLSSWAGAKVFYLLSADIPNKKDILPHAQFWLGGGFVFYGGLIFGLAFTAFFAFKTRQPMTRFNIFIPALSFGHAIGRVGCFLAGCCYGKEYAGLFSIHLHGSERFPAQLMEAFALFIFGLACLKNENWKSKNLVINYFLFYGLVRFVFEFFRGDRIRGLWLFGISTSQIVSIALVAGLAAFYSFKTRANELEL